MKGLCDKDSCHGNNGLSPVGIEARHEVEHGSCDTTQENQNGGHAVKSLGESQVSGLLCNNCRLNHVTDNDGSKHDNMHKIGNGGHKVHCKHTGSDVSHCHGNHVKNHVISKVPLGHSHLQKHPLRVTSAHYSDKTTPSTGANISHGHSNTGVNNAKVHGVQTPPRFKRSQLNAKTLGLKDSDRPKIFKSKKTNNIVIQLPSGEIFEGGYFIIYVLIE
jgi:hypothetical protein